MSATFNFERNEGESTEEFGARIVAALAEADMPDIGDQVAAALADDCCDQLIIVRSTKMLSVLSKDRAAKWNVQHQQRWVH